MTAIADRLLDKPASRYLTYPAAVAEGIVGEIKGPTMLGEYLIAVSAEVDGGKARVGFAYLTKDEVDEVMAEVRGG